MVAILFPRKRSGTDYQERISRIDDGLYQVTYGTLCAAYVVRDGIVVECAPILYKKLSWWITKGRRIRRL